MKYRLAMALALILALLVLGRCPVRAGDAVPAPEDEKALREAGVPTDGPGLLEFFKARAPSAAEQAHVQSLLTALGDDSYAVRERASAELAAVGAPAAPLLRRAIGHSEDAEVVMRAEKCLQSLTPHAGNMVLSAAVRALAAHRPSGAVEVLLVYLPFAEMEGVTDAVEGALTTLAVADGKPNSALVEALADPLPLRRAAAVHALLRSATTEGRRPLRRFLADPDPEVRLEAGLALYDAHDRDAVPALIDLLAELPLERSRSVEDALLRLAGEEAPSVGPGTDAASRQRCRDGWAAWWKKNGDHIDLARADTVPKLLGYTLVVELNRGLGGRVMELGPDGKARWEIDNLQYPIDAQVVGDDRVLIAEYRNRRVTERDFKGEVKWEKSVNGIVQGVQRLPHGRTLIVTRNQVMEVDADGRETFSYVRNGHDILAAQRARTGEVVLVTMTGQCIRLDAAGNEVKSFPAGVNYFMGMNIEVLPNGRILVPQFNNNRVVEFDPDGKVVWEAAVPNPNSVMRLPNGNTLVGSMIAQRAVELDRSGKEVWDYRADGRLLRVRRR
jgi:hypothetical protein